MKALKSKLASELLADPSTRGQLRQFLVQGGSPSSSSAAPDRFLIRRRDGGIIEASFVPKAKAKAA